jgi:hypothetical protein
MFRVTGLMLLTVSVSTLTPALAQGPGTKFGAIIGGATLSDMDNFPAVGDSRWGGTAGFLVGVNAGRTALTLEGTWVQKGGGDTRLDYIEFPLTLGAVATLGGGTARGRFYSGFSVGFKVSCRTDVLSCDNAEGTEWGLPVGLQLAKVTETGSFFGVDVRYTFALSDAFEVVQSRNRPWAFRVMIGKQLGTSSR